MVDKTANDKVASFRTSKIVCAIAALGVAMFFFGAGVVLTEKGDPVDGGASIFVSCAFWLLEVLALKAKP